MDVQTRVKAGRDLEISNTTVPAALFTVQFPLPHRISVEGSHPNAKGMFPEQLPSAFIDNLVDGSTNSILGLL
jgi:hypothetical protein